jgi:hypothetical protein
MNMEIRGDRRIDIREGEIQFGNIRAVLGYMACYKPTKQKSKNNK